MRRLFYLLLLLMGVSFSTQSSALTNIVDTGHQYDVNRTTLDQEIYGYDNDTDSRHCCLTVLTEKTRKWSYLALVSDFIVTKGGDDFFKGTKFTDKVKRQMQQDDFHSFPRSVEGFQDAGKVTKFKGGDGVSRERLEIPGGFKGKEGKFEFIKEPNGTINHRFFRPDGQ